MKKLLALVLVLGLAAVSSASVVMSATTDQGLPYNGEPIIASTYLNIIISSNANLAGGGDGWSGAAYQLGLSNVQGGTLSAPYAPTAGALGFINGPVVSTEPGAEYAGFELGANAGPGTNVPAGEWFRLRFHCDKAGDVTLSFYDYAVNPTDPIQSLVIHQIVPEPMTMSLLALGGLGLIRRRRA